MESALLQVVREAILLAVVVSGPPLAAALIVGLAIGVLQAATQVQDAAIPVVPRLVAVFASLALAGPWIGARVLRFTATCFDAAGRIAP